MLFRSITLTVRPGSDQAKREAVIHAWHKGLLHDAVPHLIRKWEPRLEVKVAAYYLQRMKTKWGSCNHTAKHVRLNTVNDRLIFPTFDRLKVPTRDYSTAGVWAAADRIKPAFRFSRSRYDSPLMLTVVAWWRSRSRIALAITASPKTSPHAPRL